MAGIRLDASKLLANLQSAETKSQIAIKMFANEGAKKFQNYAKQNRPWTDRTGHARQRLTGTSGKVANGYKLALAHGVDYGIWLELAHEKRFAIIQETIQTVGSNEIMPGFQKLLERLGKT